jgi:hypothetical protein
MAHHSPLLRRGPGVGGTANLYERVLTLAEVASRAPRAPRALRAMTAPSGASPPFPAHAVECSGCTTFFHTP